MKKRLFTTQQTTRYVHAYTVWSTVCAVLTAFCIIVRFQQSLSPPQATESTGATGGAEYSELQHGHGKGGRDKGRGQSSSTTKQVNIMSTRTSLSENIQLCTAYDSVYYSSIDSILSLMSTKH